MTHNMESNKSKSCQRACLKDVFVTVVVMLLMHIYLNKTHWNQVILWFPGKSPTLPDWIGPVLCLRTGQNCNSSLLCRQSRAVLILKMNSALIFPARLDKLRLWRFKMLNSKIMFLLKCCVLFWQATYHCGAGEASLRRQAKYQPADCVCVWERETAKCCLNLITLLFVDFSLAVTYFVFHANKAAFNATIAELKEKIRTENEPLLPEIQHSIPELL